MHKKKHIHTRHATQNYIQNYFAEPYGGISASKMIIPVFYWFCVLVVGRVKNGFLIKYILVFYTIQIQNYNIF